MPRPYLNITNNVHEVKIKRGINLAPAFTFPLEIIDIIIAEKKDVSANDTKAKILKSDSVIPPVENMRGIDTAADCRAVKSILEVIVVIMFINWEESAKRKGAIIIAVKDIVVTGISMPGAGATGCSGTYNTTVVNGGEDTFTITCALTAGSKLNSDLTVTYDEVLGLTGLTTTGTITKKVQ